MLRLVAVAALLFGCASVPVSAAHLRPFPDEMLEISTIDRGHMEAAAEHVRKNVSNEQMIRLNSFGGSVFAGLDFIDAVEQLRNERPFLRITCVVDFKAYSMAAVILQSRVCDVRLATTRASILYHNASSTTEGTARQMESDAQFIRALDESMANIVAPRLKMSVRDYLETIEGRDWTLSAGSALVDGHVDDVVDAATLPPVVKAEPAGNPFLFLFGG